MPTTTTITLSSDIAPVVASEGSAPQMGLIARGGGRPAPW